MIEERRMPARTSASQVTAPAPTRRVVHDSLSSGIGGRHSRRAGYRLRRGGARTLAAAGFRGARPYLSLMADQAKHPVDIRAGRRDREAWGIEFSRIVAFSDGVFAIAITLLALAIDIPQHLPGDTTVTELLEDQTGDLIAYAISFAVVGKLWLSHHRFFSAVERFDGALMTLNIAYLGWIALIPVTSEVLGDYGDNSAGVIVYAAIMVAAGATFAIQIVYATRNELIRPELRELERRHAAPVNFFITGVFLISIPVALVSPLAATLMWPIVFLGGRRVVVRIADLRA
jgi:uncharacterized membrane protein